MKTSTEHKPEEKTVIQETNGGFLVKGELYNSLREAIEVAGHSYVLIPLSRRG